VAIVTGGASGLGLAIARALLAQGANVALFDRDGASLDKLENEFSFALRKIDITSESDVEASVAEIAGRKGKIDILVNSAGIAGETNIRSHETHTEDLRNVFETNFMGSYYTS